MASFYDMLILKTGKCPSRPFPVRGRNRGLPIYKLQLSFSLFPLKHKHYHIYSVRVPHETMINPTLFPPPRSTPYFMPMYETKTRKETWFKMKTDNTHPFKRFSVGAGTHSHRFTRTPSIRHAARADKQQLFPFRVTHHQYSCCKNS